MQTASDQFDYEAALHACARGDSRALRGLYDQEGARLLGIALRIVRERHTAEDVLHDAFVNIWTRAGSFDPGRGSGRGWIHTVVRHLALDVVRRRTREALVGENAIDDIEAGSLTASQVPEGFELNTSLGRLHDCLARLDAGQRNCILHAYVEGCSHSEIAERLRFPLGTVKTWIRRGLNALRDCMV